MTGSAAFKVNGDTLHKIFRFPINNFRSVILFHAEL